MSWTKLIPFIDRITKWIDDWKNGSDARRFREITKLKVRLKEVEKDLEYYKNFQNTNDYRNYVSLLRDKRVLKRQVDRLAR